MKNHINRILKLLVGWPFSILALFFIAKLLASNSKNIIFSFTHIHVVIFLLGLVSLLGYFLFRALFWYKLLRLQNHTYSFIKSTFYWSFSEFRRYIPGNIWSFISRAHYFETKDLTKQNIFTLHIIETVFLLLSASCVSLLSLFFLFNKLFSSFPLKTITSIAISFILLACVIGILSGRKMSLFPIYIQKLVRDIHPTDRFILFSIMIIAWILFGVGTYFTISSIWYLSLQIVLMLVGFFTFAYLIGFLSFITPMGLGVREGVITSGLSSFLALPQSAGAALFSRIILIVVEIFFFLFSFFLSLVEIRIQKILFYLHKHRYEYFVIIGIILYCAYFITASFLRYSNFYTGRFDLGNMDQTVWNTLHGRIFQLTNPDGTSIISRLTVHADFILILLAPFYLLWQDPRMLLLIQTFVLASGAFFIYALAKDVLHEKATSVILAICYLLNPAMQYSNLYDFHPVVLATTFLLAALFYLRKKKYVYFSLFAFLAGLTKEEVWVVIGLMLFYYLWKRKKRLLGSVFFLISVGITYFLIAVLIPHVKGSQHFALAYYSDFGSSPISIVKTMLLSPQKTIPIIFTPSKIYYLFQLLLPLGFTSLFSPMYLVFALPDLAINILSNNQSFIQIYYQYTSDITPFLFVSSIFGIAYIKKKFPKISVFFVCFYILLTTLISAYVYGPLAGSLTPNIDMFIKPVPNEAIITSFLNDIPNSFSVAATNNLGSHLSHRQKIFTVPIGIDQADIIAFLLNDQFAQPSLAAQIAMVERMKHDKRYIEVFKLGDFVVFEKRNLYTKEEPRLGKIKLYPISIPALLNRDFEGGTIKFQKVLTKSSAAMTYLVTYPSDGLQESADVYIPNLQKPKNGFPVIIVNRGYISPKQYDITSSYNIVSEAFAKKGFLVIKPEYRGSGDSERDTSVSGELAYPIDVLNLLSSLHSLPQADVQNIFLWGHSTGGGVVLTTLEVANKNINFLYSIRAASVWAPVTDPFAAYQTFKEILPSGDIPYEDTVKAIGTPQTNLLLWQSVTPLFYLEDITSPLTISQGANDTIIPYQSSVELFDDLKSFNKQVQFTLYQNDDHALSQNTLQAIQSDSEFFKKYIKQ